MPILSGIHPVAEALRAGHSLERVLVAQGAGGPRLQEIIDLARRASVPVRFEPRAALDRLAGTPGAPGRGGHGRGQEVRRSGGRGRARAAGGAGRRGGSAQPGRRHPHGACGGGGRGDHSGTARGQPHRRGGQGRRRRAGTPAGGARDQHQPRARRAEEARLSGSTAWTSAATEDYDRVEYARPRRWCWAAKARGCTNRCANTATC